MIKLKDEISATRRRWEPLSFYQRFEEMIIFVLTALMALVILLALWNLTMKVVAEVVVATGLDLTDYSAFQALFGAFFVVIIALEFKKSLLVAGQRADSIVQVRTVVLIAMLAALRKLIILEPGKTDALYLFGLAAVILALGAVFWLVRDQDERQRRQLAEERGAA
ncbi:MAG: phosphate-starvation-inducible PsiE family protein [Hyphomicrobium sp.]